MQVPLTSSEVWASPEKINLEKVFYYLLEQGKLSKPDLQRIIKMAQTLFSREGNVIEIQEPVNVVGDIHGQFFDLQTILRIGGPAEQNKYLFLGDYVDRGYYSIEVMVLLLCLKINYRDRVFLLRGNHESRYCTETYTFLRECIYKYDQEIYNNFNELFDSLPLAAVLNRQIFAVHGGISPYIKNIKEINQINRFQEIQTEGPICDFVWADPSDQPNYQPNFVFNNERGVSFYFGPKVVNDFLELNNLSSIIRAHQVTREGYQYYKWNDPSQPPSVITIFSAPLYNDELNNKGAIMKLNNRQSEIIQFDKKEEPFYIKLIQQGTQFVNAFELTLDGIQEKLLEIITEIYKPLIQLD